MSLHQRRTVICIYLLDMPVSNVNRCSDGMEGARLSGRSLKGNLIQPGDNQTAKLFAALTPALVFLFVSKGRVHRC